MTQNVLSDDDKLFHCIFVKTELIPELVTIIHDYLMISFPKKFKGHLVHTLRASKYGISDCRFNAGVVTDGEYLYICDINHPKIVSIDKKYNYISSIEKCMNNTLKYPTNIFICGFELFVADHDSSRINVFSIPSCEFVRFFVCEDCWSIYIYKSEIYVLSVDPKRCHVFTIDGQPQRNFSIERHSGPIYGMVILNNQIYISNLSIIEGFSLYGKYLFVWDCYLKNGVRTEFHSPKTINIYNDHIFIMDESGLLKFNDAWEFITNWDFIEGDTLGWFTIFDNKCFVTCGVTDKIYVYK